MQRTAHDRGWTECERLAEQKRIIKLNIAYRTLKSFALLQLKDARRGVELLRTL
jgi:hypothetical protein